MNDPIVLHLETATTVCSVALFQGEKMLSLKEQDGGYSHAENLHLFIEEVMGEAGLSLANIDAVAVSQGPGSYTGLRIGVSAAKGLCYALDKPLIATETLHSMAEGMLAQSDANLLCPMIDARRMEVYSCIFDRNLNVVRELSAVIVDEHTFDDALESGSVAFFGDGAEKLKSLYEGRTNALFPGGGFPSARFAGKAGLQRFVNGQFEDVAYFEPFYLKSFVATTPKKLI